MQATKFQRAIAEGDAADVAEAFATLGLRDPETHAALAARYDAKAPQRFDAEPSTPSAFGALAPALTDAEYWEARDKADEFARDAWPPTPEEQGPRFDAPSERSMGRA